MTASSYSSQVHNLGMLNQANLGAANQANMSLQYLELLKQSSFQADASLPKENTKMASPSRRLVQVFVADADENVPLESCLLFNGAAKLTDLTDQELFYEIDIKTILDAHNEKRTKLVNKKVKERIEYLEPARIRDLKMTVVTIASF